MVLRLLFIIGFIIILFFPIYKWITYLSKKFSIIESENLENEIEKVNNTKNILKKELKNKINELEKEHEKLTKLERN